MDIPGIRNDTAHGLSVNENDQMMPDIETLQRGMTPDPELEVQSRAECTDTSSDKSSFTGSPLGGGDDIGPVYCGRRHSISLN